MARAQSQMSPSYLDTRIKNRFESLSIKMDEIQSPGIENQDLMAKSQTMSPRFVSECNVPEKEAKKAKKTDA